MRERSVWRTLGSMPIRRTVLRNTAGALAFWVFCRCQRLSAGAGRSRRGERWCGPCAERSHRRHERAGSAAMHCTRLRSTVARRVKNQPCCFSHRRAIIRGLPWLFQSTCTKGPWAGKRQEMDENHQKYDMFGLFSKYGFSTRQKTLFGRRNIVQLYVFKFRSILIFLRTCFRNVYCLQFLEQETHGSFLNRRWVNKH